MTPIIKTKVRLHIPEIFPVRDDMADKWADGQVRNARLVYQRLIDKIPDAGAFNQKLAIPSNLRFAPYVPDAFISTNERNATAIRDAHYKNLLTAYKHWRNKLTFMFETVNGVEAKRFKDQVIGTKDSWAFRASTKSMRFTGDRVRGKGAGPIAAFWLTDDSSASGLLREGQDELLAGAPYNIALEYGRTSLRSALVARLTQAGMLIVNSDYNSDVILKQNTVTAQLLTGLSDPAKVDPFVGAPAPDKSYCSFVKVPDGPFYLEIQVAKV